MHASELDEIAEELRDLRWDVKRELLSMKCEWAAIKFQYSALKLFLALRYRPDQPRVPAGRPDGGRWTTNGGGAGTTTPARGDEASGAGATSGDANITRVAENNDDRRYTVDLVEEEAPNGIGHTIRRHVDQTDAMLFARARLLVDRARLGNIEVINFPDAFGSFHSLGDAHYFVNQTLRENKQLVDEVAAGRLKEKAVEKRFGYVTGKEAHWPNFETGLYMRPTYSVRVIIWHDAKIPRGYRVRTSFPVNLKPATERKMDVLIDSAMPIGAVDMRIPPEFHEMGVWFDFEVRDMIPDGQDFIDFGLAHLNDAEKQIVKRFLIEVLATVDDPRELREIWSYGSRTNFAHDSHLRAVLQEIIDRIG